MNTPIYAGSKKQLFETKDLVDDLQFQEQQTLDYGR